MPIAIDQPETTGPDLIAGCAGAKAFYSCPCIVVDLGTATTLAVLDRDGVMVGGAIVPGVGVSHAALDCLGQSGGARPCGGRDTAECLQSGVLYGAAAMLDGLCDRMEEELGYPLPGDRHRRAGGPGGAPLPPEGGVQRHPASRWTEGNLPAGGFRRKFVRICKGPVGARKSPLWYNIRGETEARGCVAKP